MHQGSVYRNAVCVTCECPSVFTGGGFSTPATDIGTFDPNGFSTPSFDPNNLNGFGSGGFDPNSFGKK